MPTNSVSTLGGEAEGARLDKAPQPERIEALTEEIRGLSPDVSPGEAADCAAHAIQYSEYLRDTYDITKPVEINNMWINLGFKKRGLCFQLADDLQAELRAQGYRTLYFERATAHWGDINREHNCVVVTGPGQPFEEGLVLDAWRNAGILRWSRVKLDHYPWIARQPRPTTQPTAAAVPPGT